MTKFHIDLSEQDTKDLKKLLKYFKTISVYVSNEDEVRICGVNLSQNGQLTGTDYIKLNKEGVSV